VKGNFMDFEDGQSSPDLASVVSMLAIVRSLEDLPFVAVAPEIPVEKAKVAVATYLDLLPDERLLALISPEHSLVSIALTDRGVSWLDLAELRKFTSGSETSEPQPGEPRPWAKSRRYARLPETISVSSWGAAKFDLGDGELIRSLAWSKSQQAKFARALVLLGQAAREETPEDGMSPASLERARWEISSIQPCSDAVRTARLAVPIRQLVKRTHQPPLVTLSLIVACGILFGLMIAQGVSATDPTAAQLYRWGANFGLSVAIDGEYWRLFTSMFLHSGFLHLAMNMICLAQAGQLVERLYGRTGFLVIYLIAGLGGSIASASWHPIVVSVGASGAIFGVMGAWLAFLLMHRKTLDRNLVMKGVKGSVTFVALNLLPGFLVSRFDNAAHIGGLIAGMFAGFCMTRPWPVERESEGRLRRLVIASLLVAITGGLAYGASVRIRHTPSVEKLVADEQVRKENAALVQQLTPLLHELNNQLKRFDTLLGRVLDEKVEDASIYRELETLSNDANRLSSSSFDALTWPQATEANPLKLPLKNLFNSNADHTKALLVVTSLKGEQADPQVEIFATKYRKTKELIKDFEKVWIPFQQALSTEPENDAP
jgi:rhomboid protease GluP